ncbi:MAG: hypothetical protein ACRDNO_21475 [Trebonia sp.]
MAVEITEPMRGDARDSAPPRRRGKCGARRLLLFAAVGAACAGLCCCYVRLSATFPGGSDGASNALEAWDLLHGNALLRGWTLTDVSFYTTELPEYAAVELARGLNPAALHVAAALTCTLLILVAAILARGRARGAEGWARALIAAGVMVAPQLGDGVHVLLAQPDHVGTQVLILGTFLVLERAPRRWYTPIAVWALLTVAIVADKITIVDAVVPLAFVGLLHAVWTRQPSAHRFELSVAVAAGAALATAQPLLTLISRIGGFTLLPVQTALSAPGGVPGHLSLAWHGILSLFGAEVTTAPPGPQTVLAWLHAPGIALAVAAFAVVAWHVPSQRDFVGDGLAVAIVVNLAGFVASVIPATPFDTREIAALLPFGAVLAGRVFGPRLAAAGPRRARAKAPGSRFARFRPPVATLAVAVAGACQLAALGYGAVQPAASDPEQALAGWLAAHGLTTGLGTFTDGNLTTLDSGGAVRVLPVSWVRPGPPVGRPFLPDLRTGQAAQLRLPGGAVPRLYQSSAAWYDPRAQYANFVVSGTADGSADLIPRADVIALAGAPAGTYEFRSFTIMVWDENLLALLGGPPSRLPGSPATSAAPDGHGAKRFLLLSAARGVRFQLRTAGRATFAANRA